MRPVCGHHNGRSYSPDCTDRGWKIGEMKEDIATGGDEEIVGDC